MKTAILSFILLAISSTLAKADSDGYYCSSPTFLAYEFSFSKEPRGQHKLYIIPFRSPLPSPVAKRIPEFQVHGMKCTDTTVELLGWDKKYIYSFTNDTLTFAFEEILPAPGSLPEDYQESQKNLAGLSPVMRGRLPKEYAQQLAGDNAGHRYELRIERQAAGEPCKVTVVASIIRIGQENKTGDSVQIYKGMAHTECGE